MGAARPGRHDATDKPKKRKKGEKKKQEESKGLAKARKEEMSGKEGKRSARQRFTSQGEREGQAPGDWPNDRPNQGKGLKNKTTASVRSKGADSWG